jgi:outer membrane immunogenic protein
MLRRILLASAGAMALAGTAVAADLPYRGPPPVYVPPPPVMTWTGVYVGLNAGYTWSASNAVNVVSVPIAAIQPPVNFFPVPTSRAAALAATGTQSVQTSGFIGGGQIGYNYQFGNSFVVGLEADIQGVASARGRSSRFRSFDALSSAPPPFNFPGNFATAVTTVDKTLDYLGTVRGRIGFLITPTLLVYGDGGLAYGGVSSATSIFGQNTGVNLGLCCGNPPFFSAGRYSNTRVGWTAGGGIEWMFLPNWSAKVEYLYYDLGTVNYSAGFPAAISAGGAIPAGSLVYQLASRSSTHFNGNVVRAGINYHFNWGYPAPVVAKY